MPWRQLLAKRNDTWPSSSAVWLQLIQTIIACINDPTCSYTRESEQEENVRAVDPDEKTPSGPEVLQWLPLGKQYTSAITDHIISLFDHIANAQSEASLATANISAITKITDTDILDIVLGAAVRLLVQINFPENFLSPVTDPKPKTSTEKRKHKIIVNLLSNSKAWPIQKEPKNNPTRLLATVMYLKMKRMFLNEGTQRETEEKFLVHSKQLSKLLSGKHYLGGKDKKAMVWRKRKSLRSSIAVKDPDNDGDNKEGQQAN